jgi:hypothetical protein
VYGEVCARGCGVEVRGKRVWKRRERLDETVMMEVEEKMDVMVEWGETWNSSGQLKSWNIRTSSLDLRVQT